MSTVTPFLNLVKPAPLENFSRATYNNNLDLIDADSVNQDKAAKGQKYIANRTSDSTASADLVVDFTTAYTFKAGRNYEIEWDFSYRVSDTTTFMFFSINSSPITEANTGTVGIAQLTGRTKAAHVASVNVSTGPVIYRFKPGSDTPWIIKFRMQRVSGTGVAVIGANAGEPSTYIIRDLGIDT
jgi:hypothetical protein